MRLLAASISPTLLQRWFVLATLGVLCWFSFAGCPQAPGQDETGQQESYGETLSEAVPQESGAETSTPKESSQEKGAVTVDASEAQPESNEPEGNEQESTQETTPEAPVTRCTESAATLVCKHNTAVLDVGLLARTVYWQTPIGTPPKNGWPVVIMFQGSLYSSKFSWTGIRGGAFGIYNQTSTIKKLLDAGYAVLTPVVKGAGTTFWDTNIPPYNFSWTLSPDHAFMVKIFEDIEQGVFGPLNAKKMYAFGISSGGYMTSRMAVAYPGKFRALAIHSGSYATCAGSVCVVPSLPKDHPPTLFLHGTLDLVVPVITMYPYRDKLKKQNTPQRVVENATAAHEWISAAPQEILDWFQKHP